jgi:hypothetical protein
MIRTFFILALLAAASSTAYSCSCADPTVREKFRTSDLVFVGRITDIQAAPSNSDMFVYTVTLHVEKKWKGAAKSDVRVLWAYDRPGWCNDLPLAKGQRYLIYTSREKGSYGVYPDCGTNYLAETRSQEIAKLNGFWFRVSARLFPYPRL